MNFSYFRKKQYELIESTVDWSPMLEELIESSSYLESDCVGEFNPILARKDILGTITNNNFLHFVVENGNNDVLEKFLKSSEEAEQLVRLVDDNNQTPLHIAISMGNYRAVCLLCEKCNDELIKIRNWNNEDVMQLAARKGILEIFMVLFNRFYHYDILSCLQKTFNETRDFVLGEFINAVKSNDQKTVCEMLDVHPRLKVELNEKGWNALHEASRQGNLEMVKLLLEYRKNYDAYCNYIEMQTEKAEPAFFFALKYNHIECVKILIDGYRVKLLHMPREVGVL
eukprot:TRINITY_DN2694_c0_g1_i4.p1 TRINITY_DN2694_c0_g1~~TRINITY_DN2694_c0_g1_i4.p1  ORF type:complete len:284 (-),score=45.36 TRINITY_DN2694_c0_g1_i4:64-915(-)